MMCEPVTVTTIALGLLIGVVLLFLVPLATYSLRAPVKGDGP